MKNTQFLLFLFSFMIVVGYSNAEQQKNFCYRFKKVIVSKPYFFPMFVDLIMTSITDVVFFGGDESHGDWHQSARTSRAPHRHNDLYPLKNTQIPFKGILHKRILKACFPQVFF